MSADTVRCGKLVSFSYSIINAKGVVVENSDQPITYRHGSATEVFPQVVEALEGCAVGDEVTVRLAPAQAYGDTDPDLTFTDDIDNAPPEARYVGAEVEAENDRGEVKQFRVTRIGDGKITADANHPLAGETVTFRVAVAEVRDPTPAEATGNPAHGVR
ncbi:MAG: peptidylprolyl isomerase [Proteobacteria bacterium]|nr:MAG: peptidylprolyl isomerase [Pseudomonadota bacterium]